MKNRLIFTMIIFSLIVQVILNFAAWSAESPVTVVWTTVESYSEGISSLAIYQTTDGTYVLLAGTDSNDVLQITNNDEVWSNLGSDLGGIIALSPDYNSDQTIFAASWNAYYVHKSIDGGISWSSIDNGLPLNAWWSLAISPDYTVDQTLFMGGNSGIHKSTDAGLSWIPSQQGLTDYVINAVEISPDYASDKTLFAGGNNRGVFNSTDGGMNWQSANQGLPDSPRYIGPSITALAISPAFATDRTIFAGVFSQGTYRSTDAGASWQQIYPRDASAIGISPSFEQDQTLFLSTYTGTPHLITMSRDGGQTWDTLDTSQFVPSYYIASILVSKKFAEDDMIFCAGDIGAWKGIISVTASTTTIPPVLVTITEFIAVPGERCVSIQWGTASELDNAGYNIYRSDKKNGEYLKINTALISAQGSPTQGASYEFIDKDVKNRKTYYYKLEDIDLNGKSTMQGPVSATPRLIYVIGK